MYFHRSHTPFWKEKVRNFGPFKKGGVGKKLAENNTFYWGPLSRYDFSLN